MTDDKLTIKINIADRYYPLKINRVDEHRVRKAATLVNNAVTKYRTAYDSKDVQDFLAMVAVHFATNMLETKEKVEIENFSEDLNVIKDKLSAILTQE